MNELRDINTIEQVLASLDELTYRVQTEEKDGKIDLKEEDRLTLYNACEMLEDYKYLVKVMTK